MSRFAVSKRGGEPAKSAGGRLSKRQKRLLCWLDAEERRTDRVVSSSHQKLVQALPNAKGNISHSLRLLEHRGFIVVSRTLGGKAESLYLTAAGRQQMANLVGSYE
jgi:DNA-binding MarR family transcriptional regulator